MNEMPLVTIMIPTYNQAQYIEQCIESALEQDYSNLEVIISDDSTNDETESIVKDKYLEDQRVKYFHNTPALGRVCNYHKTLFDRADGDYILNLDGDDWLIDPQYITEAVEILNTDTVVCVTANCKKYIEKEKKYIITHNNEEMKSVMTGSEYLEIFANNDVSLVHMATLYRRDEAIRVGFYNKDIIFTDVESILRLICKNSIAYIDKCVGVWRLHSNNTSHLYYNVKDLGDLFTVENSIADYCKDKDINDFSLKQWKLKMQLKHLYPLFANGIKGMKFYHVFKLLCNLFRYDLKLFLHFHIYVIKKIAIFTVRKTGLLVK